MARWIKPIRRMFIDKNRNPFFILAGDYHYFRIPYSDWKKDFDEIEKMGLNSVFVYVPPCVHNPEENVYSFEGFFGKRVRGKPVFSRNVAEIMELAMDHNLYVFLRPGPIIVGELPENGLPLWLRPKYGHEIWSRIELPHDGKDGAWGTYPALNHPLYLKWVKAWYSAIKKYLGKFIGDPVVAWQLDNETKCFEPILSLDKNRVTLKRYRRWLKDRYKNIENLNKHYGTNFRDFNEVVPPEEYPRIARQNLWLSDWIRFHAIDTSEYLFTLKKYVNELFPGNKLMIFVNDAPHTGVASLMPMDIVGKTKVAIYGIDLYPKVSPFNDKILDYPFLSGTAVDLVSASAPNNPTFGAEVGMGWWMHPPIVDPRATEIMMVSLLAHGIKGMNFYPIKDGWDYWDLSPYYYMAPFSMKGKKTKRYEVVTKIIKFIRENMKTLLNTHELDDDVAILINKRCFYTAGILPHLGSTLFIHSISGLRGLLTMLNLNVKFIDISEADVESLKKFKLSFIMSNGVYDRENALKIKNYVKDGGILVSYPYGAFFDKKYWRISELDDVFPAKIMNARLLRPVSPRYMILLNALRSIFDISVISKVLGERTMPPTAPTVMRILPSLVKHRKTQDALDFNVPEEFPKYPHRMDLRYKGSKIGYFYGYWMRVAWDHKYVEEVITDDGEMVGYKNRYGEGVAYLVGTFWTSPYDSPGFFDLPAHIRVAQESFVIQLLTEAGIKRNITVSDPEVEVVARVLHEGRKGFIFAINRKEASAFTMEIVPNKFGLSYRDKIEITDAITGKIEYRGKVKDLHDHVFEIGEYGTRILKFRAIQ